MKNTILMAVLAMVLTGCQTQSVKVKSFIEGTYVNHTQGDLAVADDTLIFTHEHGDRYSILRHTGYRAIRNGKILPKKHQTERLESVFDAKGNLLNEVTTGRVYGFDPDAGTLILKQTVYRKLN